MRYDSARAAGLNEATIANVDAGYQAHFNGAEAAALALTDCLLEMPNQPSEAEQQALVQHFTPEELGEIALGVGMYMGMSKVLIMLGLEPEPGQMPITTLQAPGA